MTAFKLNLKDSSNALSEGAVIARLKQLVVPAEAHIWIAFSGGVDSTVLLQCASKAFDVCRLGVVHIHHGLSEDADDWQRHCALQAESLGLNFVVKSVVLETRKVEWSGRQERYRFFDELTSPDDIVLTAHHADDETESLLWQLSTGRALIGISEWFPLSEGRVWRPFLGFKKAELIDLAKEAGWCWIEDESNQHTEFTRNALRHLVVPQLRSRFADFDENLKKLKRPSLPAIQKSKIAVRELRDDPVRVRAWLFSYGITPRETAVSEVLRQMKGRLDSEMQVRVSESATVRRFNGRLHVVTDATDNALLSVESGVERSFQFGNLTWKRSELGLPDSLQLLVRNRQGGESIEVQGKSIKLSKWFYENSIPPWERAAWPLLYAEDRLVAVPGFGVATEIAKSQGWLPIWQRHE